MKRGLRLLVGREVLGEGRRAWCRRTDSTSSPWRWSESLRRPSRRRGTGHPVAAALLVAGNDRSEATAALPVAIAVVRAATVPQGRSGGSQLRMDSEFFSPNVRTCGRPDDSLAWQPRRSPTNHPIGPSDETRARRLARARAVAIVSVMSCV